MMYHCADMTYDQYQDWLANYTREITYLCGAKFEDGYNVLFPYQFIVKRTYRCEKCLEHDDLPLLVLSFTDMEPQI